MGTTAQKLQAILDSKDDIKNAIEAKGVTVDNATLAEYAGKIYEIQTGGDTDGLNGFLSVESKAIATDASSTTNIAYNKKCGIHDENGKKWDTLEWHQRWVDNGYSAVGLSKPTGIWMNAFGLEMVYLWPLTSVKGCLGNVADATYLSNEKFKLGAFCYGKLIKNATSADRTVWPCNQPDMIAHGTAGKYKSATFRTRNNGDGLDMICDNTGETFTIPSRDVNSSYTFMAVAYESYMWAYYQQCEFCRALFAICSGIATAETDGTTTTVEILNASGQQAAVNEDMYFWIGGTNTNLLAKYNLNCFPQTNADVLSGHLTQSIADWIYTRQLSLGINMNDTGVNSETYPLLVEGAKGAEAIAVDGYWYIKTPFISRAAINTNAIYNCADVPAAYLCKHYGVTLMTDRMLYPYWLNKDTHISSLITMLRNAESLSAEVPSIPFNTAYVTAIQYNQDFLQTVNLTLNGTISVANDYERLRLMTCPSTTFKNN